jgi:hypothetical protein
MTQSQYERYGQDAHWHFCSKEGCKHLMFAPSKNKYSISSAATTIFFLQVAFGMIAIIVLLSMAHILLRF